jgi:Icc-related predicted phosphoesterase
MAQRTTVRIAAVGDTHYGKSSQGHLMPLFEQIAEADVDLLLLAGDITDYGLPEEADILVTDLRGALRLPVVGVLGNHDFESGLQDEVRAVLGHGGITILDGGTCEVHGIGIAGVKGFAGGFGRGALGPWGEQTTKAFVQEALNEALKLESALARLKMEHRIALVHYAPIQGTVEGEPPVIYPFLGSSRLEEPLNRYPVTAVFHGHAHHGTRTGRTSAGVPVHNVSAGLLRRENPDGPWFHVLELTPGTARERIDAST